MKTRAILFLAVLLFGINFTAAESIVVDDFNSYTNGSVVGQGGWESYKNGENFVVQDTTVFEGTKALYNYSAGDNVVGKTNGSTLVNGRQVFYLKSENRNAWDYVNVRVTKGLWAAGWPLKSWASVNFMNDGNVAYYDKNTGLYHNFATFAEGEWTLLEIEWRSSDSSARYRVNEDTWTDWSQFGNAGNFVGFDYVGLDLQTGSSGGVYFDALGANSIPEPATIVLFITGLIAGGFLLRRK